MPKELKDRKVAILATDGVEQVELEQPRKAVEDAGAQTELLSINSGEIQAMNQDIEPGDTFTVDREVSDASVDEFDALLLPGGTVNPDRLRMNEDAVRFERKLAERRDILGHEFMGEITDIGPEVQNLKAGDRVVVPFPIACGNCNACKAELYSVCENSNPNAGIAEKMMGHPTAGIFGYSHMTGGFAAGQAEAARVPFADVGPIKIENGISDEQVLCFKAEHGHLPIHVYDRVKQAARLET